MPENEQPSIAELEAAVREADAACQEYADRVSAERRRLMPGDDRVVERAMWPPEQQAELERLREARMAALRMLWAAREQAKSNAE